MGYFYPRSPCGERLNSSYGALEGASISIHALLAESDNLRVLDGSKSSIISIHALLAESDSNLTQKKHPLTLSIHALLAESDGVTVLGIQHKVGISIHALLAESDVLQS